jgi:hypothetical protein
VSPPIAPPRINDWRARAAWQTSRIAARPGSDAPSEAPSASINVWSLTSRSMEKWVWKSRRDIAPPLNVK